MNSSTTNGTWTGSSDSSPLYFTSNTTTITARPGDYGYYSGVYPSGTFSVPFSAIQSPSFGAPPIAPVNFDWEEYMREWTGKKFVEEDLDEYQIAKKKWERYFGIA